MTLLWLSYGFLSLVVLITGYLGLAFLPRLPRLVITWAVAGVMWVPARFQLPLLEEGAVYQGFAPAVIVAAVGSLEDNAQAMMPALLLTMVGAGMGVLIGLLLWWRGRHGGDYVDMEEDEDPPEPTVSRQRREPKIG
ncbi:hypothetical protein [Halomonas sp.]|uniref:hypothetical protein n=1 Tax=Halomonas sp. TaxID=1486246 RepID=UPI003564752F